MGPMVPPATDSAADQAGASSRSKATHATCNHPAAELVVFSKLFTSLADRPSIPCATSTRHAYAIGRNSGCRSGQNT
jgi:hypothetical protein